MQKQKGQRIYEDGRVETSMQNCINLCVLVEIHLQTRGCLFYVLISDVSDECVSRFHNLFLEIISESRSWSIQFKLSQSKS